MKTFLVTVKSESFYYVEVKAESKEDAKDHFNYNLIDWSVPDHLDTDICEVEDMTMPQCPKCRGQLSMDNVSDGYMYQCPDCDEDFYAMEV